MNPTLQYCHNGKAATKKVFSETYNKNDPIITTIADDFLYDRVQTIVTLASSITHELKGYLGAINIYAELPKISSADIKQAVKAANFLLNSLQTQIKSIVTGKVCKDGFKLYSITKNIIEALEQYPFKTGERELITIKTTNDFKYIGNPALTNQIFFNLIKNAMRAIRNTEKGTIVIKLESGDKFNGLIFKDTASGIAKDFLPKIFGLFESQMTTQGGTGVGLAFCKTIMRSYGGDITCDSIEGKYTEFALKFPAVSRNTLKT